MADRPYDRDRLKHLFHYVIWAAGARAGFGATKLYKVAWFADARRYVLTGQSITGAPYMREKHGPIPREGIVVRNELAKERAIEQWRGTGGEWVFKAITPPMPNVFDRDELKEINYWIKEIDKNHTATSVSDFSHDYGWEIARMHEPLPFHSILAGRGRDPDEGEMGRLKSRAKELGLI